ncbi:antibiotic biosynthesis monooxygenase family protein [Neobacillus sp. Marseille-QA0830]
MNVYLTTGTIEYLKKIMEKHPEEKLVAMENADGALLIHETKRETVFKLPRRYEAIESRGELAKEGLVVMNHIPVTDEGRPLFEHKMKLQNWLFENEPGLLALRCLRPIASKTYIILTIWEKEASFEKWQSSNAPFSEKVNSSFGIGQPGIFENAPYIRKYFITE